MIKLLDQNVKYYNSDTVQVADRKYPKVNIVDTKRYIDSPDEKEKAVSFISSDDAVYTVYTEENKFVRSTKQYNRLVSKKLGSKVYDNIASNTMYSDGTKVYETINPRTYRSKIITITPDGNILDKASNTNRKFLNKIAKPIKKIGIQAKRLFRK